MDKIVQLTNVTRQYQRGSEIITALDSVNLSINRNEYVAVTGPSGSGKSTFLNMAGAIDKPTSGNVLVAGQDTGALNDGGLAKLRADTIGFVFQQFFLQPTLTALENVLLPTLFQKKSGDKKKQAETLLTRVGLKDRQHHRPAELSGGEMQRVAIARALINEPLLLLADEPTGNLDSHTADDIYALFDALHKEGLTILTVTHNETLAGRATRHITMRDGRILQEAKAA